MARIHNGILGKTTGKVASVVGGTWKGINYIRQRVVPKNPRTTLQQAQRGNMRLAVWWAKKLIPLYTRPFLDRFTRRMSGYNALLRWNILNFAGLASGNEIPLTPPTTTSGTTLAWESFDNRFTVSRGSMAVVTYMNVTRSASAVTVAWIEAGAVGLLPTDFAIVTCSDLSGKISPIVQIVPVADEGVNMGVVAGSPTGSFFMNTYRVLLTITFVRFLHPETREVPIEMSNSRSVVIAGYAPAPTLLPLEQPLEFEPENKLGPAPVDVRKEERVIGRKRRDTVLKEEVFETEEFDKTRDLDETLIETEVETRARGGRRVNRGLANREQVGDGTYDNI